MVLKHVAEYILIFLLDLLNILLGLAYNIRMQGRNNFIITKNKQKLILNRPSAVLKPINNKQDTPFSLQIKTVPHNSENITPFQPKLPSSLQKQSKMKLQLRDNIAKRRLSKMRTQLCEFKNNSIASSISQIHNQQNCQRLCCLFQQLYKHSVKHTIFGQQKQYLQIQTSTINNLLKCIQELIPQAKLKQLKNKLKNSPISSVIPHSNNKINNNDKKRNQHKFNILKVLQQYITPQTHGHNTPNNHKQKDMLSTRTIKTAEPSITPSLNQPQNKTVKKCQLPQEPQPLPTPPNKQFTLQPQQQQFITSHYELLQDYVSNQSNKMLQQAFQRHKYLQEELFSYADFLSISRVGIVTYTPEVNIQSIEVRLDKEMRDVNKNIIQGQEPIKQKFKTMRNFVMKVRQSYNEVLKELMGVIDKKTEQAKMFVNKVLKWEENYLTRKEYLCNLKKDYCQQMFTIRQLFKEVRVKISESAQLRDCGNGTLNLSQKMVHFERSVNSIEQIFMLGNSFY